MLQIDLENILTEEDALGKIQNIFTHVENEKEIYVITKNDRPAVAIIDVERLELLSDQSEHPKITDPEMESSLPPLAEPAPQWNPPALPNLPLNNPPVIMTTESSSPIPSMPVNSSNTENFNQPSTQFNTLPPLKVQPEDLPNMPEDIENSAPLA